VKIFSLTGEKFFSLRGEISGFLYGIPSGSGSFLCHPVKCFYIFPGMAFSGFLSVPL